MQSRHALRGLVRLYRTHATCIGLMLAVVSVLTVGSVMASSKKTHGSFGEDAIEVIDRYGRSHAPVYGGLRFMDDGITVAFTRDLGHHQRALQQELRLAGIDGVNLRVVKVRYTERQLLDLVRDISDAIPELRARGISVNGVGVDAATNRVVVFLEQLNPRWVGELRSRFGHLIRFEESRGEPTPA